MTKPITPAEVVGEHSRITPDSVFEAFNELIAEKFTCGYASVRQDDVIERILLKNPSSTRAEVFEKGWLNIEGAYRDAGWLVEYDKPAYNESGEPFFRFTEKKS